MPEPAPHCPSCTCVVPWPATDSRQDPRWRLAMAECVDSYPELGPEQAHRSRSRALNRTLEISLLYEIGFPGAQAPSFPQNRWSQPPARPGEYAEPAKIEWDPERLDGFLGLWHRIVYYRLLAHLGVVQRPQDAVKAVAVARREWVANKAREDLERVLARPRIGAGRYLRKLKDAVREAGGPCTYCGDPNPGCVDHMMPTSRGGADHPANLTISCIPCNSEKNNRTPEEWKAARLAKGLPWPPVHQTSRKAS